MYAFDVESYYDKHLNVRELGAFNYLARADVYLVSFWGPDGGWVGHPFGRRLVLVQGIGIVES
jgi:hypothetical protein